MPTFLAPEEYTFDYLLGALMTNSDNAVTGYEYCQLRFAG
jgi:hypothetical protein